MSTQAILVQEEPRGPSQLVEVPVTANGLTRVAFPDIQQLRSDQTQMIIIKGMRLVTDQVLTNAIITAGICAPLTELQHIAVTLYAEGWEKGQSIPILHFNDMASPGTFVPNQFKPFRLANWKKVDWQKSYLQYANGTSSNGATYVVMFDVLYERYVIDAVTGKWTLIEGAN